MQEVIIRYKLVLDQLDEEFPKDFKLQMLAKPDEDKSDTVPGSPALCGHRAGKPGHFGHRAGKPGHRRRPEADAESVRMLCGDTEWVDTPVMARDAVHGRSDRHSP